METFVVTRVIDGDTFDVSPGWIWSGKEGVRVRPIGYDTPELNTYEGQLAKARVTNALLGREIQIGKAVKIDRDRLVCDVYYNGRNLSEYFN